MRQTDDYLLITNSKPTAMNFIERLTSMAADNKFQFNMRKLRANFKLNVQKISYTIAKQKADAKAAVMKAKGEPIDVNALMK